MSNGAQPSDNWTYQLSKINRKFQNREKLLHKRASYSPRTGQEGEMLLCSKEKACSDDPFALVILRVTQNIDAKPDNMLLSEC